MNALLTPSQADKIIQETTPTLPSETIPFQEALARTLRAPLSADRPFPPFDRVTMDGIACRMSDLPLAPLTIQGLHPAGSPAPEALKRGHCWQIMTGAVLPPDCDTLIPVEELILSGNSVTLSSQCHPTAGQHIHREGSDCPTGATLLAAGTVLKPSHLGLAATIGATELLVTRKPRVRILTTGDELVLPCETPLPYQLRQSNGPALVAACQDLTTPSHQHLPDDLAATISALEAALPACDLILLSGGISKGKKDYIRPALESLLGPPTFHGIAQRPGKPLAYWKPSSKSPPIFALPGNPNSTLTTFFRYALPALHRLAGNTPTQPITLPLTTSLEPHPQLTLFLPVTLLSSGQLEVHRPQNSGDFASALTATGFIEVAPGTTAQVAAAYSSH